MADYELWYFLEGEDSFDSITISKNAKVNKLRKEIHKESCSDLCYARELVLLKVDIVPGATSIRQLQAPDGATVMGPMERIEELWPDKPTQAHLHVCVRLPNEPSRKRPRREDATEEYMKGPLVVKAPSAVAAHSEVFKMQMESKTRVANDRPHSDADHLPIALLYHGFGRFLDAATGAPVDDVLNFDRRQFELNVDGFMTAMNLYYANERERNNKALLYLNKIFQCYLGVHTPQLMAGVVHEDRCSNGHVLGLANTIEVVLDVKDELSLSRVDPTIELAAYYTQSLMEGSTKEDRSRFFFPALGIVVISSHIGFYALAYTSSTRLVALTPLLPTTTESGNNWVRPALLNARNLPYVNEVAAYSAPGVIRFHIRVEAYQGLTRYPNRFLYLATLDSTGNKVVVKFTRRYFPQLHLFCAEQGRAPQLLGYGIIPGSWHVVVMEWIDQEETNLQNFAPQYLSTWSENLKSLVKDFHDKGWVHGDLRDANLIVSNQEAGRVMLVDFDWGGDASAGPVHYPTALVNEELINPMEPGNFQITKEYDDRVLASTLEKLAGSA
ncbi:hypothetical protein BJY52DRAFT_1250959 [Lactarius psammicola]|nr:hypothetical protein BJY52DRAFT_1250959 [Lactarius psammicola]